MQRWIISLLALGLLTLSGCGDNTADTNYDGGAYRAPELGTGQEHSLLGEGGQLTLVNVWATWCEPCIAEMPYLEALHTEYQGLGLRVVGVNVDSGNASSAITRFVANQNITFPILLDPDNSIRYQFRTLGVPETLLLDERGQLLHRWRGPIDLDPEATEAVIEQALSDGVVTGITIGSATLLVAFLAGVLSFLSPCVLPLVPVYLALISGCSISELSEDKGARAPVIINAIFFVAGFSAVFIALGATASTLGQSLHGASEIIARVGGVIVIVLGLHMLGVLRIPLLYREYRPLQKTAGKSGTLAAGMAFAAGWTPCIGPVLATILAMSATTTSLGHGIALLTAYSAGLALPFLLAALFVTRFLLEMPRLRPWLPRIEKASGILCVGLGILLVAGIFTRLSGWFAQFPTLG